MERAEIQNQNTKSRRAFACVLLFFLFSFLGWAFEKILFYFAYGVNADRGFLTLPFCTVYGSALLLIRVMLGFPFRRDSVYPYNMLRFLLYAFAAGLITTIVELSTGLFFEEVFQVRLWTYVDYPHAYRNYICLPVSVGWGASIAIGMGAVWEPLERAFSKLPLSFLRCTSAFFLLAILLDFLFTAFL